VEHKLCPVCGSTIVCIPLDLYDAVICYFERSSKRREADRLYREVLKSLKDNRNRPVDIFLEKLNPLLNKRERRMMILIEDFIARGLHHGIRLYHAIYIFPKPEICLKFEELMPRLKALWTLVNSTIATKKGRKSE
jgi:hypothetical protein